MRNAIRCAENPLRDAARNQEHQMHQHVMAKAEVNGSRDRTKLQIAYGIGDQRIN